MMTYAARGFQRAFMAKTGVLVNNPLPPLLGRVYVALFACLEAS